MSELKPLIFPADVREATQHAAAFPFTPANRTSQHTSSVADNRMQQLEQMLQEAQGRAEIVEKEAYDKAYLAGEKAGMTLGKKRGEQILETVQASLKEAEHDIATLRSAFAEAAMDVAEHIAEQIIGRSLAHDRSALLDIARQAANQLPDTSKLHIAVSADDYATFKRMLDDDDTTAVLRADPTVTTGTCRVISADQDILIDPVGAVAGYLSQLQPLLLGQVQSPANKDTGA
ncbi:FliH/SctL family protein [Mariprofundus ferrooxydans]|uniref:FliH/SctL family protein n=1 Tax=Mariprofundus ferrooxydans TaxID=314344 RepID=UPI00142FDE86|nr:FliH/SctL family protein [Mariprofundus ferrooxydans]